MTYPPLHPTMPVTKNHLDYIANGFTDQSLPKDHWTHAAHIVTALYLLDKHDLPKSSEFMPAMIKRFNEAKGGKNTDTDGYHHTITIFYLKHLSAFREKHAGRSLTELCNLFLTSPEADKGFPLQYYSKDLLFSVKARRGYVKPDLLP